MPEDKEIIPVDEELEEGVEQPPVPSSPNKNLNNLVFRSPKGTMINKERWLFFQKDVSNGNRIIELQYYGYDIYVKKQYIGTIDKLYQVSIEVSADVTKYYGYTKVYNGSFAADTDYDRIVSAIGANDDIVDETKFSSNGEIALFYDERYGRHVVNMVQGVEAWTYPTRAEAEAKFLELTL